MLYEVITFSPQAVDDLNNIKSYVSDNLLNPKAADELISLIFEKIRVLKSFPQTGTQLRTEVSILNGYRFVITSYSIHYTKLYDAQFSQTGRDKSLYGT